MKFRKFINKIRLSCRGSVASLFSMPSMSSPAYPPNFLQALLEFSNFIDACKSNESVTKEELIKSAEMRLSNLIGKTVSAPTGGSFSVFNRDTVVN